MAVKILLVNSDKDHRESADMMLKTNGYLVVTAADCDNALSFLATEKFDLILLDMTLPDKSASIILEHLKEHHSTARVIVITGASGFTYPVKSIAHVLSDRSRSDLKLQIINAGDLIKVAPTGTLDMTATAEGLAKIASTGAHLHDYRVLIDLRDVQSRLSVLDIYDIASGLSRYGETFHRKTALLVQPDEENGQAAFFEDTAQNRGFDVRAFTDFEESVLWLSSVADLSCGDPCKLNEPITAQSESVNQ